MKAILISSFLCIIIGSGNDFHPRTPQRHMISQTALRSQYSMLHKYYFFKYLADA
nr:MAG TPA: hypothetical protein [Caudoviricetes sp.]